MATWIKIEGQHRVSMDALEEITVEKMAVPINDMGMVSGVAMGTGRRVGTIFVRDGQTGYWLAAHKPEEGTLEAAALFAALDVTDSV